MSQSSALGIDRFIQKNKNISDDATDDEKIKVSELVTEGVNE